jgi:two-component system nitrogen regulation sensor histidine kinase NtrY
MADMLLGRFVTLVLAVGALLMGIGTFTLLSNGSPFGPTKPGQVVAMVLVNAPVPAAAARLVIGQLVRVWAERRRGSAGSRLHVRLVLLFSVDGRRAGAAGGHLRRGVLQPGHPGLVQRPGAHTLEASLAASRAYLDEHRNNIRADALAMANDLNRAVVLLDNQYAFARILATQARRCAA